MDISRYSASFQYSYTSDGTEKCLDVTVTYGDKTLATGTDFTQFLIKIMCEEGTATVTITGAGNYTGIINTTFTITPAPGKDDSDGKDNPGKDDSGKNDSMNSSTPGNNNNNNGSDLVKR